MYEKAPELYNELLETYFDGYNNFLVAKTKKIVSEYEPKELFLEDYDYDGWYKDGEIPIMPPLELDEEVHKNELSKMLYILYQHNKITRKLYNNSEIINYNNRSVHWRNKLVITTETKTFHFDLPKDVGNNLKHEIDFIIKHKEFLADQTMENKISRLLSKYKYENDIHKHGKQ